MSVDVTERFRALAPLDDAVLRGVKAPGLAERSQAVAAFDLEALELVRARYRWRSSAPNVGKMMTSV